MGAASSRRRTDILAQGMEGAQGLPSETRRVIESMQEAIRSLQSEVQTLKDQKQTTEITSGENTPISIEGRSGIKVINIGNRKIIKSTGIGNQATGANVQEFEVVEEFGDYLQCQTISVNPITVYVAKPFLFRDSSFNEKWVNGIYYWISPLPDYGYREATDNTYVEYQSISPEYYQGDRILAINHNTGIQDEFGQIIYWEDLNMCGRTWAANITLEAPEQS